MQHCGKCSNYNSDDSIFCNHCGNRLNNRCPDCGFLNLPQQAFCGNCNKQLMSETEISGITPPAQPAPPPAQAPLPPQQESPPSIPDISALRPTPSATVISPKRLSELPPPPPAELGTPINPTTPTEVTPADEAHFEDYAALLTSYALVSIEFANWDQLSASGLSPEQLDSYRRQCLRYLEERAMAAEAQRYASRGNIIFLAFNREADLNASLHKAIDFSLELLGETFRFHDATLKLKMGMDIEHAKVRDPLTSTLERSVGLPGTLTVSETVYEKIRNDFRTETVGPIPMGNRMLQCYRILKPGGALPDIESVVAPSPSEQKPLPTPSPPKQQVETPPLPKKEPTPPPPATEPLPKRENQADEDLDIPLQVAEPSVSETIPPKTAPAEPSAQQEKGPPSLPRYQPPLLGLQKASRASNVDYGQAIDALVSEVGVFLAQNPDGAAKLKGKITVLCAADGLGKSNIINMVRSKIDPENQRAIWMGGHNYRCFQRNALPLYYWLEMMQNLLSLVFEGQAGRDVKTQIQQFLTHIYESNIPEDISDFLLDFLSVHPPQPLTVESREQIGRIEHFFFQFFRDLSAKRPLIVVMEDLSHADAASLELLNRLLEINILELPVYFILTQTPDFYASGALQTSLQKSLHKELVISELDDAAAEHFLDDGPLGGHIHDFPVQLIDMLVRNAKGLPLYLEEGLRLLHLREVLTVDSVTHKFIINGPFNPADAILPGKLGALVRLRLEHLSEKTLYVLQMAAVLGEKFSVSMLMALCQFEEGEFNQSLTTLFNHGYLVPDVVNTGRFRHGLLWQTLYETIEPDLRIQMHQLVSEALENDFNQQLTVNPMLIAYHAENGELPNRALSYWNLAGIYAGQVGSVTAMNQAMFHALDLLKTTSQEPLPSQELALRIVENLGVFNLNQEPDLAINLLEWVFYSRSQEGDFTKLIEPLGFLASAYEFKGDFPKALVTLEKALELVDPQTYPMEAASLQISRMEHMFTLGRLQQSRELMDSAIEPLAARQGYEHGDPDFFDAYLQARLIKSQILLAQCDNQVIDLLEKTMRIAREQRLEGLNVALQLVMGQVFLRNGQYESCNREADNLLNGIEAMDDPGWFLAQWGLLAIMYHCELEDWNSASQLILTVVSKSEAARDYHTCIVAQLYAGYISGKLGKTKEARQVIEQAIQQASDYRFASAALIGWRFLADFELGLGNKEVAAEIAGKALEIANKPEIRNIYEIIQLSLLCARALLAQGNTKAAGKLLEPLWPRVAATKMQPLIAACAYEIGQLYKRMAQDAPADLSKKHLIRSVEFFLKAKGIWLELRHLPNVKRVDTAVPKI